MKGKKAPFCANKLCEFNGYKVKEESTQIMIPDGLDNMLVDRYKWVTTIGEKIFLCDCCSRAAQMITKG